MVGANTKSSMARRLYLSVYNWVSFFGWAQVLCYATLTLLVSGYEAVYTAIERPLALAQTAALADFLIKKFKCPVMVSLVAQILHSFVGFVRSPVTATVPQVCGRIFVVWGVLWNIPETHSHILLACLVLSWSITEVIRYSFYGMTQTFGFAPSWLIWLRYSTFIVLYPAGFISEVGLIYVALSYLKASENCCFRVPVKWNFNFDYYASALSILFYLLAFPYLYRHMLAQRKKVLSKAKTA